MNRAEFLLRLDQLSSSYLVILILILAIGTALVLFKIGFIPWAVVNAVAVIHSGIRSGFHLWQRFFSWASWTTFLSMVIVSLFIGWLMSDRVPVLTIAFALIPMFMGLTAVTAYMFIDQERYAVSRGYKAVYHPLDGQELAVNLVRYGQAVGVPLLVSATVGLIGGFALLNFGLYQSFGHDWYKVNEGQTAATYVDFVANALIVLLRIVDVLDFVRGNRLLDVSYVRQVKWPSTALLTVFRMFFAFILVQQIIASVRQGLVLSETISDMWNPSEPINERAFHAFPQYGPAAVDPLLTSLGEMPSLPKELRERLHQMLADIGPAAIPALARHLRSEHEHVRAIAASTIGQLKIRGTAVLLAPLSHDPSEIVRECSMEALGSLASPDSEGREIKLKIRTSRGQLWTFLKRDVRDVRMPVIEPVELAVKTLQEALADSSMSVRFQAARSLGRIGPKAGIACTALISLLKDEDESVRKEAIEALGNVRGDAVQTVAGLVQVLDDPSPVLKAAAAKELGELGEAAKSAIPALAPLLQDREDEVRDAVAEALGQIGNLDDEAADELIEGLESPDSMVRAQTAEALGTIGECALETAPALVEALSDRNDMVRAKAVEALGRIGEAVADLAVPGLIHALQDPDNIVSSLAAKALGEMGDVTDSTIASLIQSLQHINGDVRANAAESLGKLSIQSASAIVALERACQDEDTEVQMKAIRALGVIDQPSVSSRQAAVTGLDDDDAVVRLAAVEVVCRWNRHFDCVKKLLLPLMQDSNEEVRAEVAKSLPKLIGPTPEMIDALCERLRDDTDLVQGQAAESLGALGSAAASAGEALLTASMTADAVVREKAIRAITLIRPSQTLASHPDCELDPEFIEALREIENQNERDLTDSSVEMIPVIATSVVYTDSGHEIDTSFMVEIVPHENGVDADTHEDHGRNKSKGG